MKRAILIASIVVFVMATGSAWAETRNYMFLVDQSSVVQTGGVAGISETHSVTGQFQLTVDFSASTASFDWVDATLSESPFLPTRSLDQIFYMTRLLGTVLDSKTIEFVSPWPSPCPDIRLNLTLEADSVHLTCSYCTCPVDGFCYELDAVAAKVPPGWTYQYSDDFKTDKAKTDSYTHSVFWPGGAFPPPEPYLYYYPNTPSDRALVFMDYAGQPAHLGYCFPVASPRANRMVKGILKIDVAFPENAHISQSPPGYLLYSLSSDGHNWSTPKELRAGHNQIPLESLQGTCYVIFLGTRVTIDNLAVHLNSPPATIHVPADFPTIQQAIDAASDRDVIEVAPGTYRGDGNRDIVFRGKAITVRSAAGPDTTIIDCESAAGPSGPGSGGKQHRGFYFHQNEQRNSVLRGFTIINGRINGSQIPPDEMRWGLNPTHPVGGGIYCEYSSPTIVNCVVRSCGTEIGGGIGCVGGQPRIVDCLIEECTAGGFGPADSGGRGGGIGLIRNTDARINNCVIRSNTAYHGGSGAGVYARRAAAAITNCEISFNSSRVEDGLLTGGGVYASDPQTRLILKNCILSGNSAVAGSAVYSQRGTNIPDCSEVDCPRCCVRLTNCTVAHNRLTSGPSATPEDAAIQSEFADIALKNSIVYYNEGVQIFLNGPHVNPIVYSDIQGGHPGTGNIDALPLFAPTGVPDYHLQSLYGRYYPPADDWVIDPAHSPCIDAGDPEDPVAKEPLPNGKRINMGAYGGTTEASKGRASVVYQVDGIDGSDSNSGLSREKAFATIQKGIDSSQNGDVVLVWPAVYTEDIAFDGKAITVQSAADAAVVVARSDYAFSFFAAETPASVLRNFVITNSPYGIYCDNGARPTLTNLTIAGNEYGIAVWPSADPNISNCILWDNSIGDLFSDMSASGAAYSCIERLESDIGPGNFSKDPLFADPGNDDYHLRSRFGRYWPEHDVWVIDDHTSPCIDAGDPRIYPEKERIPNGGRLNIGAFGGTPFASMSSWPLRCDVNGDGLVNMWDFALMADGWLDALPWAHRRQQRHDIVMPTNGDVIPAPERNRNQY